MDAFNQQPRSTPPTPAIPITSLLSPPQNNNRRDSFQQSQKNTPSSSFTSDKLVPTASMKGPTNYPSPKYSPLDHVENDPSQDTTPSNGSLDPPLFGAPYHASLSVDVPLFGRSSEEPMATIEQHMARPNICFGTIQRPAKEDYQLVASFQSTVYEQVMKNPRAWLKQEKGFLQKYNFGNRVSKPAKKIQRRPLKQIAPAPASGVSKKIAAPMPRRVQKPKQRVSVAHSVQISGSHSRLTSTPEPKKSGRNDVDFESIPDYSPALSTLPGKPNDLKVEWRGSTKDWVPDEYTHLLAKAEVDLAKNLRLSSAVYLTSKRRIFQERVSCLKRGKEFRKTDAQQACNIDVNKASKLWQAFDQVNWLDKRHFEKFL